MVGRTGAGKSSFFQLLQGFRPCSKGQILVNGVDLSLLTKEQLRKNMNVVLQNPYVNEGETVKQNLLGIWGSIQSNDYKFSD